MVAYLLYSANAGLVWISDLPHGSERRAAGFPLTAWKY
jgi:hypothetical protein